MTVSLRHRVEYAGVVGLRALIRIVPMPLRLALGTLIGVTFYALDAAHRRLAVTQIRAAFPTRSAAECRAIARATFVHFGRALVLLLDVSRLSPDAIRRRVGISFRYFFGELAHSQVYRKLRQLEELGWVSARDSGAQGGAGRSYRISAAGLEELRAWARSAQFDPPTLRFPIALKIWLGHLTGPQELQDALLRQQRYVEEMRPKMSFNQQTASFLDFLAGRESEPRVSRRERLDRWAAIRDSMGLMPEWARRLTGTYQPKIVERLWLRPGGRVKARLLRWAYPELPCKRMALARVAGSPSRSITVAA